MPEPNEAKANQITDNIRDTLGKIRKPDGYWFDVNPNSVTLEDRTLEEIESGDLPYLQLLPINSDIETAHEMPHRDLETFELEIWGLVEQPDAALFDRDRERSIRDVRKKLQEDTHRGTLAGVGTPLALWTSIRTVERLGHYDAYPGLAAFLITIEVRFKYDWTQP